MAKLPVGIQVYNLRALLQDTPERFEEIMTKVKELGYDVVELAGTYGIAPEKIREILDKVGLRAVSAHIPLAEMMADTEACAKAYKTIGIEYAAVPYLPEEQRVGTEVYPHILEEIARIAKVFAKYDIPLLYHNHDFEFTRIENGKYALDDMYDQIPDLSAELDTCWVKVAGEQPVEYIQKYAGRLPIVHLKDFIKEGDPANMYELIGIEVKEEEKKPGFFEFRPVGFGMQIWEPILNASVEAGAKYVIVEQDQWYDLCPLEAARRSREYLRILGW